MVTRVDKHEAFRSCRMLTLLNCRDDRITDGCYFLSSTLLMHLPKERYGQDHARALLRTKMAYERWHDFARLGTTMCCHLKNCGTFEATAAFGALGSVETADTDGQC